MSASGSQQAAKRQYRIAIAEDNELMREGISCVVAREKGFKICGAAGDKKSTLALVEEKEPDILLLNLFLRNCDGIELIKHLTVRFPLTRIVVTGAGSKELYDERLRRAGASASLPQRATVRELIEAIRKAVSTKRSASRKTQRRSRIGSDTAAISALTDRELHVFRLIGRGRGTGDIALELGLSRKTIEYYREQIKLKLGYCGADALRKAAFEWAQR